MKRRPVLAGVSCALLAGTILAGCKTAEEFNRDLLARHSSPVALRSVQSRVFDTSDRAATVQSVIASMQDLGFVIDQADAPTGIVSGTKLDGHTIRMSVNVRPRGDSRMVVRASAQIQSGGGKPVQRGIEEAVPYQRFFAALGQAMFLSAHEDGRPPASGVRRGATIPRAVPGAPTAMPDAYSDRARIQQRGPAAPDWRYARQTIERAPRAPANPVTPVLECGSQTAAHSSGAWNCDVEVTYDDAPGIVLGEDPERKDR